jgi:hypothetical protein
MRSRDWRVYAVRDPTPLAQGPAAVTGLTADSVTLRVARPGSILLRVHTNNYWALRGVPGCVAPAGAFTRITATRAGQATLTMRFSLSRIGAHSRRCAGNG